jgi:CheY-like chemotaxis protein
MRRILVVDDSRSVRQAIEGALEPYGFEVELADNGAAALAKLRRSPFDLVFLDLNMPVLDGPGMLRILRHSGIPVKVVLVTSGASTATVASTVKLGASDYLQKPFTAERVREMAAKALDLDPAAFRLERPRVLVQGPGSALRERLAALLPEHVVVEGDEALARCLEMAERQPYRLVLLDHRVLEGEVETAADLVRARLPEAAILAIEPGAGPERRHAARGELDGTLPPEVDEGVAAFLHAAYLRSCAESEPTGLRAAGHRVAPEDADAWYAQLRRAIVARGERWADETGDAIVDLTRVPADVERLARLVGEVREALAERGVAPTFRVAGEVHAALAARAELAKAVIQAAPA